MDDLLKVVAREMGVSVSDLRSSTRGVKQVAWARQVAMHLAHLLWPEASWSELGRRFDRDRTTVRHAIERVAEQRDLEDLDALLTRMEKELRG